MPFLTDIDERAQVKGSRDPLGLVPLWSRFGREVIGNLTTVSNSVRGFTTLLVGLELADMLRERLREDAPTTIDTFLKFEQLSAYARFKYQNDKEIRGFRRVAQRLGASDRFRLSAARSEQILSNQKIYGLWGLFTVPARSSGLLRPGESRLTPEAQAFVHRYYIPMFSGNRGVQGLLDILRKDTVSLSCSNGNSDLLETIGRMHSRSLRADERLFYRDHLAWGGPGDSTGGRQRALTDILAEVEADDFGFPEFRLVQKAARKNDDLAHSLEKIARLERLIAPSALLFGFLQVRDGQTVASAAKQIEQTWRRPLKLNVGGLRDLQTEIGTAIQSKEESELWMSVADSLSKAAYPETIKRLIQINTAVMLRRHSAAAWIGIESGRIRVRLSDERSELTSVEEAEQRWRSTYFINSLWRVARAVRQ